MNPLLVKPGNRKLRDKESARFAHANRLLWCIVSANIDPTLSEAAVQVVCDDASHVIAGMNDFTSKTFRTRGGRLGSGMGSLLEALWVYYMNNTLANQGGIARECEFVWLPDHQPADFVGVDGPTASCAKVWLSTSEPEGPSS